MARICNLGCAMVYRAITQLEVGEEVPEAGAVDTAVRQAVLEELETVTSVYDASDGGASCRVK